MSDTIKYMNKFFLLNMLDRPGYIGILNWEIKLLSIDWSMLVIIILYKNINGHI